jgi:hypothetical protein
MKLYVTYGLGSNLKGCYSIVEGLNRDVCERAARAGTEGKFAFTYSEEEFAGQAEKYNLKEVPLQPQVSEES